MDLSPALAAYAAQILAGTAITPAAALGIAASPDAPVPPQGEAAATALRDGWAAAGTEVPR